MPNVVSRAVCLFGFLQHTVDDIVSIINLQNGMRSTGLTPSKSADDTMCEEFYKCPAAVTVVKTTPEL